MSPNAVTYKKSDAHIQFYFEEQMKDMLSVCMPDLLFVMHAVRGLSIYHK